MGTVESGSPNSETVSAPAGTSGAGGGTGASWAWRAAAIAPPATRRNALRSGTWTTMMLQRGKKPDPGSLTLPRTQREWPSPPAPPLVLQRGIGYSARSMQSVAIPQHPVETTQIKFESLGLSAPILQSIHRIGFEHPTPIQSKVIPVALSGRDLIGLAETGSGKTAAFCLPLAERLTHGQGISALILSPTREIALQTQAFLEIFGEEHKIRTVCLIGGVKMGPQVRSLNQRPDIVVATPGRLLDHIERGTAKVDRIHHLVLDEADHMLDMGFMPQVLRILSELPGERHTMMFSATMPPPIERLAQQFMISPVRIDILPEGGAASGISHRLYMVDTDDKKACLLALLGQELGSTLVFIRRKVDAEWLSWVLEREGHPVERIHSDLSQGE